MRSIGLATILLLGAGGSAFGQALANSGSGLSGGDAALTYHWVRTNTLGSCGCFSLNGGGVSASWRFMPLLAAVGEASVEHTAQGPTGGSLTLTSYLFGARRYVSITHGSEGGSGLQSFAQILVGAGHAGGGVAGPGRQDQRLHWPLRRRHRSAGQSPVHRPAPSGRLRLHRLWKCRQQPPEQSAVRRRPGLHLVPVVLLSNEER